MISHLSVFEPNKHSKDDVRVMTLLIEDDDNRRPPELRVGDYILFYEGGHHGSPHKLRYSQVISIERLLKMLMGIRMLLLGLIHLHLLFTIRTEWPCIV